MKKIVKRHGASHVIILDPEDLKIYNIEEGDIVDLSDMKVEKQRKKK